MQQNRQFIFMKNKVEMNNLLRVRFDHLKLTIGCRNKVEKDYFEGINNDFSISKIKRIQKWKGKTFDRGETISVFIICRGNISEIVIIAASGDITVEERETIENMCCLFGSKYSEVTLASIDNYDKDEDEILFKEVFNKLIINESKANIVH